MNTMIDWLVIEPAMNLIAWASFALAVAAWVAYWTLYAPSVRYKAMTGRNGYNSLTGAYVRKDAPQRRAIAAHEQAEMDYKRGAMVRPARLARMIFRRKAFKADLNTYGKEVETQAAVRLYGVSEDTYRRKEAISLVSHEPYGLTDKTTDWAEAEMKKHTRRALRWLNDNEDRL